METDPGSTKAPAVDKLITVGRIAGPYGVKGWVRVVSYTEDPESILDYQPWYLIKGGDCHAAGVRESRHHGKGLVVSLASCEDRDAAALLAGTAIGVHRSRLPEAADGEYYWNDLVGLQVLTLDGRELGTVDHLIETGANDVLVVRGERERLIPFIQKQVVRSVDLETREVRVDWDPDD